jgi:pimeloyl-ACP methyl ester carboxylesterase
MNKLNKNGVALAYQDWGAGSRAIVFIHGLGFDHTTFGPQIEYFSRTHRVIAMDLRGHGASDAPKQEYAMPVLAEDTDWLCAQLGLVKPVFVGHSMGGNVALTLAVLHPEVPASILLIDSLLFPPLDMAATLKQVGEALKGPNFEEVRAQVEPLFYLPTDNDAVRREMSAVFVKTPQHVLQSAFVQHTSEYDAASFAARCKVPAAYIGSTHPLADVAALRTSIPEVIVAQTLGSGHFSPVMVPNQINAMIDRFLAYIAS